MDGQLFEAAARDGRRRKRADEEHGDGAGAKHFLRDAAEYEALEAASPVGAHGDHRSVLRLRRLEDDGHGVTLLHHAARGNAIVDQLEGALPDIGVYLIDLTGDGKVEIRGVRGNRLDEHNLRRMSLEEAPDLRKNRLGGLGPIQRNQDAFTHETPLVVS